MSSPADDRVSRLTTLNVTRVWKKETHELKKNLWSLWQRLCLIGLVFAACSYRRFFRLWVRSVRDEVWNNIQCPRCVCVCKSVQTSVNGLTSKHLRTNFSHNEVENVLSFDFNVYLLRNTCLYSKGSVRKCTMKYLVQTSSKCFSF